jgi:hypothetical protein
MEKRIIIRAKQLQFILDNLENDRADYFKASTVKKGEHCIELSLIAYDKNHNKLEDEVVFECF